MNPSFTLCLAGLVPKTQKDRPRLSRTLVLTAFFSVLAAVLIAYRTWGVTFLWSSFLEEIRNLDERWLIISICLILITNVGRALRWQVMLKPFGRPIGVWRLTSDTAIGLTAGVAFGRVGEVVRPYLIAVQTGLPFSSQAAAWVLERSLDTLAVLLLCGYALITLPQYPLIAGGYSLAAIGLLSVFLLLAFRDPERRAQQRVLSAITFLPPHQQQRIAGVLETFSRGLDCTRDGASLVLLLAYTVLDWGLIVAGTFALFHAFPATSGFGPSAVLVLMAFMTLGSLVQLPGVGGGLQAAVIVALTEIYHLRFATAASIAMVLWLVSSLAIVPFGLACAFHEGLNWGKLKLLSTKQILEDLEP